MRCGTLLLTQQHFKHHLHVHNKSLADCGKDASRKRKLLVERGHECEMCTERVWQNMPIPLELDHIDGNPDNNVDSNLRLLCPNCHSLQATNAGGNAGKFPYAKRTSGRARYYLSSEKRQLIAGWASPV